MLLNTLPFSTMPQALRTAAAAIPPALYLLHNDLICRDILAPGFIIDFEL